MNKLLLLLFSLVLFFVALYHGAQGVRGILYAAQLDGWTLTHARVLARGADHGMPVSYQFAGTQTFSRELPRPQWVAACLDCAPRILYKPDAPERHVFVDEVTMKGSLGGLGIGLLFLCFALFVLGVAFEDSEAHAMQGGAVVFCFSLFFFGIAVALDGRDRWRQDPPEDIRRTTAVVVRKGIGGGSRGHKSSKSSHEILLRFVDSKGVTHEREDLVSEMVHARIQPGAMLPVAYVDGGRAPREASGPGILALNFAGAALLFFISGGSLVQAWRHRDGPPRPRRSPRES
jgi:hypothetical protein